MTGKCGCRPSKMFEGEIDFCLVHAVAPEAIEILKRIVIEYDQILTTRTKGAIKAIISRSRGKQTAFVPEIRPVKR